jgi:hypothetical protein
MKQLPISLAQELINELLHFVSGFDPHLEYTPTGLPAISCLAFVVSDPLLFTFNLGRVIASDNIDMAIVEAFQDTPVRKELMGRKQVVYFPDIEVEMIE